jgi:hypothetical protein
MIASIADLIHHFETRDFYVDGQITNETEFNNNVYVKVGGTTDNPEWSNDVADKTGYTYADLVAKKTEVDNAEPLRLLRKERDRLIAETDWWGSADLTMTTEQTAYRQALRDLPDNSPDAALDANGDLTGVTWPTKP